MRWGRRASARTPAEATAAVQASVGQIVKSLVFKGKTTGKPHLILVSGQYSRPRAGDGGGAR